MYLNPFLYASKLNRNNKAHFLLCIKALVQNHFAQFARRIDFVLLRKQRVVPLFAEEAAAFCFHKGKKVHFFLIVKGKKYQNHYTSRKMKIKYLDYGNCIHRSQQYFAERRRTQELYNRSECASCGRSSFLKSQGPCKKSRSSRRNCNSASRPREGQEKEDFPKGLPHHE